MTGSPMQKKKHGRPSVSFSGKTILAGQDIYRWTATGRVRTSRSEDDKIRGIITATPKPSVNQDYFLIRWLASDERLKMLGLGHESQVPNGPRMRHLVAKAVSDADAWSSTADLPSFLARNQMAADRGDDCIDRRRCRNRSNSPVYIFETCTPARPAARRRFTWAASGGSVADKPPPSHTPSRDDAVLLLGSISFVPWSGTSMENDEVAWNYVHFVHFNGFDRGSRMKQNASGFVSSCHIDGEGITEECCAGSISFCYW